MSEELKEKIRSYLEKAKPLFENLNVVGKEGVSADVTEHFHTMTVAYYNDAQHFYEQRSYINALAALEYAEGWLDAGVALGIFRTVERA